MWVQMLTHGSTLRWARMPMHYLTPMPTRGRMPKRARTLTRGSTLKWARTLTHCPTVMLTRGLMPRWVRTPLHC